jgi:hypothetical protein
LVVEEGEKWLEPCFHNHPVSLAQSATWDLRKTKSVTRKRFLYQKQVHA